MPEYIVKYKLDKKDSGFTTPEIIYDGGYVWEHNDSVENMILVGKANYKVTEGTPDCVIERITKEQLEEHKKQQIMPRIIENIDLRTIELIDYGIEYKGVRFWTDQIAQQNYTGLYVKRDSPLITYPYTVWDGTGSVSISGSDEMDLFCSNVMAHVQTQRVYGKQLRDSLNEMTAEEVGQFEDPRGPLSGTVGNMTGFML